MRAAVYDRYGKSDVVQVRELPSAAPGRGEVLVRVHAAALNPKDIVLRSGRFAIVSGRRFPRRVGFDFAGTVAACGAGVGDLNAGERVYGMLDGFTGGTCAEELVVAARRCSPMPSGLTFVEAASLPLAGLTALQALRDVGRLRAGGAVCINGASGGVGVHAVQIARALGARVTSISSARNLEFCRSLGAETTLAYDRDALFRTPAEFDVVIDAFGNRSFSEVAPALSASGTFVALVPKLGPFWDVARTALRRRCARFVSVHSSARDLAFLTELVAQEKLRPVVERVFPLESIRAAFEHLETKRARGKIVLSVR